MSYPLNVGAIAELAASREGFVLAETILGTTDPRRVFEELASFCTVRLGSGVEEAYFCELSVGAAFGLRLWDGRRVMLKAHLPDRYAPLPRDRVPSAASPCRVGLPLSRTDHRAVAVRARVCHHRVVRG